MVTKSKRPRNTNVLAKMIVDLATGGLKQPMMGKIPQRSPWGKGGLKGGKARAKSMTAKRRTEIAKKAAKTRWDKN